MFLHLHLSEMKLLPGSAPGVHMAMMNQNGAFVDHRTDGNHNGVSKDMLVEQTYSDDANENSVLDGTTCNAVVRAKRVYAKSYTATVSCQLR